MLKRVTKRIVMVALLILISSNINFTAASAQRDKPTETWNLSSKGTYYGSGNATTVNLFSNYMYTGASKLKVMVNNLGNQDLTVEIYRSDDIVCYYRYVIPAKEGHIFSMNSNSSKKYYFKFIRPCKFDWWVKAG